MGLRDDFVLMAGAVRLGRTQGVGTNVCSGFWAIGNEPCRIRHDSGEARTSYPAESSRIGDRPLKLSCYASHFTPGRCSLPAC
jgi:hypothetical protein